MHKDVRGVSKILCCELDQTTEYNEKIYSLHDYGNEVKNQKYSQVLGVGMGYRQLTKFILVD